MPLTSYQRRSLIRAREIKDGPFPIAATMARNAKSYAPVLILTGAYAWWTWDIGFPLMSAGAVGFLLGFLARDLAWFRMTARMWPVTVQVTNWTKVDELLAAPPRN